MSKVVRIWIQGIRSFGPEEQNGQDIKFASPVTLILGENGCGKTTIIEALKFACTGKPPGVNNQFVYNPQLIGRSKVKAAVKLKLIDNCGDEITVSKLMQVEQTTKTLKFTTLDNSVNICRNGVDLPISSRCADVSRLICEKLGVTETILNNVIFCHQENSLWPLDDGSKVKAKFDEIFDSTKYTKCIDSLRAHAADKTKCEIKLLKERLETMKDRKDSVEKMRANLQKLQNNLERLDEKIEAKEASIEPVKERLDEIVKLKDNYDSVKSKLTFKESELKNCELAQQEIKAKITNELSCDESELKQMIFDFLKKMKESPSVETINESIKNCEKMLQQIQVKLGQLQEEKNQYNNKIKGRDEDIGMLGKELGFDSLTIANNDVDEAFDKIKESLSEMNASLKESQSKFSDEENKLQGVVDANREELAKIEQKITSNKGLVKEIKMKLREIEMQLKNLGSSDEQLKQMNVKIDKIDSDMKRLTENTNTKSIEEQIKADKLEIQQSERSLESLEEEYNIMQKNYGLENDIETRTKDIDEKQSKVDELKAKHCDDFNLIFGEDAPESNLKDKIQQVLNANKIKVKDLEKKTEQKRTEITKNETNLKFTTQKLKSLETELATKTKKISKLTDNKPYENLCKDTERELEMLQKQKGQLSSAKILYGNFVKKFTTDKPCCPICETDFNDKKSAVAQIVNKLNSHIKDIPGQLERNEKLLTATQENFKQLQQLKPIYEQSETLKNKQIPELKSEIAQITETIATNKAAHEHLKRQMEKPEKLVEVTSKIIPDASLIDKYRVEIEKYKAEVENLKDQLIPTKSDKIREEIESEINNCKMNINQKRQSVEYNQKKIDSFKEKIHDLKESRNRFVDKRFQLEKTMHEKPQKIQRQKELGDDEKKLQDEIRSFESQIEPVQERLCCSVSDLEVLRAENKSKVNAQTDRLSRLTVAFDGIKRLQCNIEEIAKKNIDSTIAKLALRFDQCKTELAEHNSSKERVTTMAIRKRELNDNLDLRMKKTQEETLKKEIAELKTRIGDFNNTTLLHEKQKLELNYTKLVKETCTLKGEKAQLEKTISDLSGELNLPLNKNAYGEYKSAYFKLKLTEKSQHDLVYYIKGLENAVIDFHKEKMVQINHYIKKFWRSIYRGNDIDYVQIKTEQPPESTAMRRVYNYKVVQVKNDVELEMKGCCSAGQKVLACLIIRMALSSVFSSKCGILALDEPTTNLDKENIVSLSQTIAKMVQDRRIEKAFQLIVITHDEDFVRSLANTEELDSFLRVRRDARGRSVVTTEHF